MLETFIDSTITFNKFLAAINKTKKRTELMSIQYNDVLGKPEKGRTEKGHELW